MARGDNLQLSVKGEIQLSGPPDGESAARSILEGTLRILFADLNDPLVCPRFAATGIADDTAEQISRAPWVKYRVIRQKKPRGEALKRALGIETESIAPVPFVPAEASSQRLAELQRLIKKARGRKRVTFETEASGLAFMIGNARVAHEGKEKARVERLEKERTAPIKVFVKRLDVKYRNPPNPQWKWWSKIVDERNTMQPGTFTP